MFLAASAVIQPSRLLRLVLATYALACLAAAAGMLASLGFHLPEAGAAACLAGAAVAAWLAWCSKMTRGIDVSGLGEIRLTVQHGMGRAAGTAAVVELLPGSTLWPDCLLLLLQAEMGARSVLVILPDCLPPDDFRNISIALRAVARRDNKFFEKNKIL